MAQDLFYTECRTPTLYVSHIRRSQQYEMRAEHAHAEWELYFLLSGERRYFIRDHVVNVKKGDLILIPAGEIHKSLTGQNAPHERITVEFRREFLDPVCAELLSFEPWALFGDGVLLKLNDMEQKWVQRELFRLLSEVREKPVGWEDAIRLILINILLYLKRIQPIKQEPAITNHAPEWFNAMLQYIAEQHHKPLTLTQTSAQFFLHPSHVSRVFQKTTGMTFMDYLAGIRVREARRLLAGKGSVSQIAEVCGFGDATRFGRVFKRAVGQTPTGYRKTIAGSSTKK